MTLIWWDDVRTKQGLSSWRAPFRRFDEWLLKRWFFTKDINVAGQKDEEWSLFCFFLLLFWIRNDVGVCCQSESCTSIVFFPPPLSNRVYVLQFSVKIAMPYSCTHYNNSTG
mmetsp:Transcript_10783/g.16556  ORF Transcript_10783/g.16556 Transcript_10783/m.16556 type:complete len:112 (+) Transcript_10783:2639-2974(+)